jgi:hypothetical protein
VISAVARRKGWTNSIRKSPPRLAAGDYVYAAFDHEPRPSAMLVQVTFPVGPKAIDQNRAAALFGDPDIFSATLRVNTDVSHPERGAVVYFDIGRA